MNPLADLIRGLRRPRRSSTPPSGRTLRALLVTPALAGLLGLSLLVSACGGSPESHVAQLGSGAATTTTQSGASSAGSAQQKLLASLLAYSHCMRLHGVANFPDPDAQGQFPPFHSDSAASKQTSLSAGDACKNLLRRGGNEGTPQDRQEKFAFALKVARCLRLHGFPRFPDPPDQNLSAAGIDPSSTQFQAAETACENQARKVLGLP